MTRRGPALAVLLALAALSSSCSKSPSGSGMLGYSSPTGHFSLQAPGDWRVSERAKAERVTFFGPPQGPMAYAVAISVSRHPSSALDWRTPQDYYGAQLASGAQLGPLEKTRWKRRAAYRFTAIRKEPAVDERPSAEAVEETLLIPDGGGFVAVSRSSSLQAQDEAQAAFASACQSLKLR